jgi:hypothetical protein
MQKEQLELKIKKAVMENALSKDALTEFSGQPGTGLIHPCVLKAVVNLMLPLYEENEMLKRKEWKTKPAAV